MQKTSKVHKFLYHYTDLKGVRGILQNQSLWATHYQNLNDETEITLFAKEVLPKIIEPALTNLYADFLFTNSLARSNFFANQEELDSIVRHDSLALVDALLNALRNEIYICSFCGETSDTNIQKHGKLSQWRGYGSEKGRFCIVFDTEKLEEFCTKEYEAFSYMGLGLGDIVYSDQQDKFQKEFKKQIQAIIDYVPSLKNTFLSKKIKQKAYPAPYKEFIMTICRYKHFGFKEESEVRVYAHLIPDYIKAADNRKIKKTELKKEKRIIDLFSDTNMELPITRIIVGPHSKKEENIQILTNMLKDTNIQLDISEIPFLD